MDGLDSSDPGSDSSDPGSDSGTVRQTHDVDIKQQRIETKRDCLLVFEGDSSRIVMLPTVGEFVIGREKTCDLAFADYAISRRHAVITIGPRQVLIRDLESQNGTRLNGERIADVQPLVSGDTLEIGTVSMILQRHRGLQPQRPILDLASFLQRVEEETDRALRYHRPLSVLSIALANKALTEVVAIRDEFRMMDVVGRDGTNRLAILMPETSRDEATAAAHRLLGLLKPASPRIGIAVCPNHGCEPDTLLASARAAARSAVVGGVTDVDGIVRVLEIGPHTVVLADPAMLRCYDLLERLAPSDLPILIDGETGTGKEVAAAAVHDWSRRKAGPFVTVNCAALPDTLLESELFGHERGAFTGATGAKPGTLERAHGGTVFLDELGELSPAAQAKLLRVLETHQLTRVGATSEITVDIRVVAATHRDLTEAVAAGTFRQDLFFRLSGCTVTLPPLRNRPREIPLLAERFLRTAEGVDRKVLSDDALHALIKYPWPGNLRELRNLMTNLSATVDGPLIEPVHLKARLVGLRSTTSVLSVPVPTDEPGSSSHMFRPIADELRELEIARMRAALDAAGGNQTRAAALIQMPLRTFQGKAKQYNLPTTPRSRTKTGEA